MKGRRRRRSRAGICLAEIISVTVNRFQLAFILSAAVASALSCSAAQIENIASRASVGTSGNALITGFALSSGPSAIIVRALGPSLSAYGIAAPLMDPILEVHDSTGAVIATNDNWRDTQQQEFGPGGIYAPFRPGNESEPAIAITLQPGSYTAVVRGKNGTTGIALAEVYIATGNSIENVSSRALVGTGDGALIGGLITTGDTGEFVIGALGDRGIGLSKKLSPRLSASLAPAAAAALNTLSFASYQTALVGGCLISILKV